MSLTDGLKEIDSEYYEKVARRLAGEHNYSDHDFTTKCAAHRKKYPVYDFLCKKIENNGKPLLEETLLHSIGMELMLRTLIIIGEEKNDK